MLHDVEERLKAFVKTEIIEVPQGELVVLQVFKDSRDESIVGGRVKRDKITVGAKFRLLRQEKPIDEGTVLELQQNKQTLEEVKEGVECGMKVRGVRGIKPADVLSCYREDEREVRGERSKV